jgi:hypothetical protein
MTGAPVAVAAALHVEDVDVIPCDPFLPVSLMSHSILNIGEEKRDAF